MLSQECAVGSAQSVVAQSVVAQSVFGAVGCVRSRLCAQSVVAQSGVRSQVCAVAPVLSPLWLSRLCAQSVVAQSVVRSPLCAVGFRRSRLCTAVVMRYTY